MAAATTNDAVPPPHASLRLRRHSRSLASLFCPQPPSFLRLDSLARLFVVAVTSLAAAVETAMPLALSAAIASAWYAGKRKNAFSFLSSLFLFYSSPLSFSRSLTGKRRPPTKHALTTSLRPGQADEIPVPMPGYTLKFRPAPTRLAGVFRLLAVALACSLAGRVRNAVREEAFRKGRAQLTREGLRNIYGSDGKLRSTLLLSPFKVGGCSGGSGGGGGGASASAAASEGGELKASSSDSMTLVGMVEELFEAVLGGEKEAEGDSGKKRRVAGVDVADDLRRVCEAVCLSFRPEVEGANVRSLRAAAARCREEVLGKGK